MITNLAASSKREPQLILLIALCVLSRLVVWFAYQPMAMGDTADYLSVAGEFQRLDFSTYDGHRPPLYPVFLALCGLHPRVVWCVQALLGIVTAWFFYRMAKDETSNAWVAFAAAAVSAVYLDLIFIETSILTESVSRFFLAISLWMVVGNRRRREARIGKWILTGFVTAMTGMTHPLFLFLIVPFLVYVWVDNAGDPAWRKARVGRAVGFAAPIVVLVVALSIFNQRVAGYLGPTSMTGFNLVNHSGAFIEYAPERYAVIRDTYLPYRNLGLDSVETGAQTIWRVKHDLEAKTGWSFVEMSRQLTRMSVDLFVEHPGLYLRHAAQSWRAFWLMPIYWHVDKIHPPALSSTLRFVWRVEKAVGLAALAIFFLIAAYLGFQAVVRGLWAKWSVELLLACTVLLTSVAQAAVDYGQNPRYLLVELPLIFYLLPVVWHKAVGSGPSRSREAAHAARAQEGAAAPQAG